MATVSGTFTAVGVSSTLKVGNTPELITFSLSGTYAQTIQIEKSTTPDEAAWEIVKGPYSTANASVDGTFNAEAKGRYRFRCVSDTSGTSTYSLSDGDAVIKEFKDLDGNVKMTIHQSGITGVETADGVGTKNGDSVAVVESGDGAVHKTVVTLANTPLSVTSVTTGAGVGGVKIYDFPEGYIQMHGCTADLSLAVETEADFTDGTPQGDVGIGTAAPADADALGTDATDDNFGTATAFTMSAFAATVDVPPEATLNVDGTTTPVDAYVNALVDAADIDDSITTNLLVSGTVTFVWSNLGDY
jgi:hypothetical protein